MKAFLKTVKELCFPPRCVGCGERLPITLRQATPFFCAACALKWERCMLAECPQCFAPYVECRCQPRVLRSAGSLSLVKLAPYDSEDPTVLRDVVLSMKLQPRARAFSCCARDLTPGLIKAIAQCAEKGAVSRTVITYLPRTRKRFHDLGFDQAHELAKHLSRTTGIELVPLLRRVHDGEQQKTLTLKERQENCKGAFALRALPKGWCVILVDDLVTTGAGMAEAVKLLRQGGAARVLTTAVAVTPKKKRTRGEAAQFPNIS